MTGDDRDVQWLVTVGTLCEGFGGRCGRGLSVEGLGEWFEGRIRSVFEVLALRSRRELLLISWKSFASAVGVRIEPLAEITFYCRTGKVVEEVAGFLKKSSQSSDAGMRRKAEALVDSVLGLKSA